MDSTATTRAAVVFDQDCGICTAAVSWLERRDREGALSFVPAADLAGSDLEAAARQSVILLVDGREPRFRSQAAAGALESLPGSWGRAGRLLGALLELQAFRWAADLAYELVARNRKRLSGWLVRLGLIDDACRVS